MNMKLPFFFNSFIILFLYRRELFYDCSRSSKSKPTYREALPTRRWEQTNARLRPLQPQPNPANPVVAALWDLDPGPAEETAAPLAHSAGCPA